MTDTHTIACNPISWGAPGTMDSYRETCDRCGCAVWISRWVFETARRVHGPHVRIACLPCMMETATPEDTPMLLPGQLNHIAHHAGPAVAMRIGAWFTTPEAN